MLAISQLANPITIIDDNWYLDSGATHHLTPELGNLSNPTTYPRLEEVIVGDGSVLV